MLAQVNRLSRLACVARRDLLNTSIRTGRVEPFVRRATPHYPGGIE
jgi:hypothetical protein